MKTLDSHTTNAFNIIKNKVKWIEHTSLFYSQKQVWLDFQQTMVWTAQNLCHMTHIAVIKRWFFATCTCCLLSQSKHFIHSLKIRKKNNQKLIFTNVTFKNVQFAPFFVGWLIFFWPLCFCYTRFCFGKAAVKVTMAPSVVHIV